jgi:glycosyltransferase involved in cell wall biosynthesis
MRIVYPYNDRLKLKRPHDIMIFKTCYYLAQAGHQVYLVAGNTGKVQEIMDYYGLSSPQPGFKLVQLPMLRKRRGSSGISWHLPFNLFCLGWMLRLKRICPFEVVLLSEIKLGRFLLKFRNLFPAKFIYDIHGLYCREWTEAGLKPDPRETNVYRKVDAIITTTRALADILEHRYRLNKPLEVIPMAGDRLAYRPSSSRPANEAPRVFYLGQLYPLQGVDLVVDALKMVADVELHIVGGSESEIAYLQTYANRQGLAERVIFHGFIPPARVSQLAGEADILIMPSRSQGRMPFVAHTKAYEYLGLGRPILATDLPSVRELLSHQHNAFLVRPDDSASLAEGIVSLLNNPALSQQIAARACEDAGNYSWQKRGERFASFIEKVIDND